MFNRLLLAFIVLFPSLAFASAHTCGDKTVREGETTDKVRTQCGYPESVTQTGSTERWTYNAGGNAYKVFLFQNNQLIGAQEGTRTNSAGVVQTQGCCSTHGGVCGCKNGRYQCCDGTESPSCGCKK